MISRHESLITWSYLFWFLVVVVALVGALVYVGLQKDGLERIALLGMAGLAVAAGLLGISRNLRAKAPARATPEPTQPLRKPHDPSAALRSIYVATDLSAAARPAVDWGRGLAEAHGAPLVLVHASEAGESAGEGASRELAALAEQLRSTNTRVETRELEGDPATALSRLALQATDLLCVGAGGRGGLRELVLGSTATKLIQTATCPVVVVPSHPPSAPRAIRTILAPTDFSERSALAMESALRLAGGRPEEIRIVVLCVQPLPAGFYRWGHEPELPPELREQRAGLEARARAEADRLRSRGHAAEARVRGGEPGAMIEQEALALAPDLLAMGTRGRSGPSGTPLGSTTAYLLPRAGCPVPTVRSAEE